MNELVSIIVPIYNVADYLDKCIQSIVSQTYRKLEIILVDDGSTDASGEICDLYALKDKRITVIHSKNFGLVHARKTGIKQATGEYIGFVDGDDYIDGDYYEDLLERMLADDYDFVQMGVVYEYEEGNHSILMMKEQMHNIKGRQVDVLCEGLLGKREWIDLSICSLWSRLFKREIIKECYSKVPDYLMYGEDLACMCHYIMRSEKFAVLAKAGYHYVQRSSSMVHTKNTGFIVNNCKLYEYVTNIFRNTECYLQVQSIMSKSLIRDIAKAWGEITGKDIAQYEFPNIKILLGKRIVIYGAGKVGIDYYKQICTYESCDIVAWGDTYYEKYNYEYVNIVSPEAIRDMKWDILLIAVLNETTANQIREYWVNKGIPNKEIYWCKPKKVYSFE